MRLFGRNNVAARYMKAIAARNILYSRDRITNARARNAARAASNEATRKVWAARKEAILAAAGQARNAAVAVTKKIGSGLATGGLALAAAALVAANAAKRGAQYVGGKAYGAAGAAAVAAAKAAEVAAGKLRSLSALRKTKNFFMGKKSLSNAERALAREKGMNPNSTNFRKIVENRRSFARAAGNKRPEQNPLTREGGVFGQMRSAARIVSEKAKAAAAATRKAAGVAGAAIKNGASSYLTFLGKKASNAGSYLSRKTGSIRGAVNNMYTRLRYGGHEARLDAERQRAANAVNMAASALRKNKSAKGRAAHTALGKIANKLETATTAAANGSQASAAAAVGAASAVARTGAKKGWFSGLGNAVKGFTRGLGERLDKLRGMFKGTNLKVSEGRSAGKSGARLGLFGAPRMSMSAAARRLRPNQYNSEGRFLSPRTRQAKAALAAHQALLSEL